MDRLFKMPSEGLSRFGMIDIGPKRPTRRVAVAGGRIVIGAEALAAIAKGLLPKGDVLALAEAAAIAGAKNTPLQIPMCHTVPLDMAGAHFVLDESRQAVEVFVQCAAIARTGVEMEALAAVNAALLTVWDLTKGTNPALRIENVRLLVKTGGKSGVWTNPEGLPPWLEEQLPLTSPAGNTIRAAVLVMSDRAAHGVYEDQSGRYLADALAASGAELVDRRIIPDDIDTIARTIAELCAAPGPDVLLASGGTGPGARDMTPQALESVCDFILDGIGEWLRRESGYFTQTAWLSRMCAAMVGKTLVIALPGSPKAVAECWEILAPVLPVALQRIAGQKPVQASGRKHP